jgi:hypothetical protein
MWQPWRSEIAADVHSFALTSYASVAALYNVVADDRRRMRRPLGDPHPIGWLRILLGCAMSRHVFGSGPWDRLEQAMQPANRATAPTRARPKRARRKRCIALNDLSRGSAITRIEYLGPDELPAAKAR